MGTKTDVNSNALLQSLQKLAAVMESNDARKDGTSMINFYKVWILNYSSCVHCLLKLS